MIRRWCSETVKAIAGDLATREGKEITIVFTVHAHESMSQKLDSKYAASKRRKRAKIAQKGQSCWRKQCARPAENSRGQIRTRRFRQRRTPTTFILLYVHI
jgi:hypothetical protein